MSGSPSLGLVRLPCGCRRRNRLSVAAHWMRGCWQRSGGSSATDCSPRATSMLPQTTVGMWAGRWPAAHCRRRRLARKVPHETGPSGARKARHPARAKCIGAENWREKGRDAEAGRRAGRRAQREREAHGLQCGFCTPGFLMTISAFLKETPDPSEEEIREAIAGNLCRCTGYVNIIKAVQLAAARLRLPTV